MSEKKEEQISHKENLKEYINIARPYLPYFLLLLGGIVIYEITKLIPKFLVAYVIDQGTLYSSGETTLQALTSVLLIILLIFAGATILRTFISWFRINQLIHISINMSLDLKQKYFSHLVSLDTEFHNTNKTGSIISKLARGSGAIEGMTNTLAFSFLPVIIQFFAVGISLAYFSPITAAVLLITSIIFVIYSLIIENKQKRDKLLYNEAEDREKGIMADYFLNIESIKHFGKDTRIKKDYGNITEETKEAEKTYWKWFKVYDIGQTLILATGMVFVLLFPLLEFINGKLTIGTISFIYTAYFGYMAALQSFVFGIRGYYRNIADLESLFRYNKIKSKIKDKKNARDIKITKGNIEFKNIKFTYPKGEKVLKDFSLKIPCAKKVALIGHSGSGKTTLVKLLYRLYDIESGSITIDGKDIRSVKQESLRSEMAIVSQEPILFDDTIYNNIKFSKPKATKKEMQKAIRFAQLDKVIAKLPKKEHTIVGERGVKLSTGQKQRVSVARALLANKKILILDEATSALDSETESEMQKDLEKLMKNRTAIIIAHRLSTIMNADQVVVLKDGKIMQKGTHKQLIKKGGEYKKLWKYQKGGYIKDNPERN